jgi:hypothetical protein
MRKVISLIALTTCLFFSLSSYALAQTGGFEEEDAPTSFDQESASTDTGDGACACPGISIEEPLACMEASDEEFEASCYSDEEGEMLVAGGLTKAACKLGCLVFRKKKLRRACERVCSSFAGGTCKSLAAYCRHCVRHPKESQCPDIGAAGIKSVCKTLMGCVCP